MRICVAIMAGGLCIYVLVMASWGEVREEKDGEIMTRGSDGGGRGRS